MDVLEHVRELNRDDDVVDARAVDAARRALRAEIEAKPRPAAPHRARWVGATAALLGATATVLAIGVVAPARVDPAAASVLERAADVAIAASDPTVGPGQYLRIETHGDSLVTWDADPADRVERLGGDRSGAEAGIVVRDTRVFYVPADRSGVWIQDESVDDHVVESYGRQSDAAEADWEDEQRASSGADAPDILALPGGELPGAEGDPNVYLLDGYRASYQEMPRDPGALLEWFRSSSGDPDVTGDWVVQAMSDAVSANLMPADLRAATLRALALVPGIRVASVEGDETTLEYRSGDLFSTRVERITVDTSAGLITSTAQTTLGTLNPTGVVPDAVPDYRHTVSVSVVESAPVP